MLQLSSGQWSTLFNMFSFGLISMLACTVYTLVAQSHVLAKYRLALVMSSMVTFIAGYHYWRIFNSFEHSSMKNAVTIGTSQGAFNEAYRYVDWILTMPLLLVEVIAVLALAKEASKSLIRRLVVASAAMIILGYPGEISAENGTKMLYFVLSMIPFLYILYVLLLLVVLIHLLIHLLMMLDLMMMLVLLIHLLIHLLMMLVVLIHFLIHLLVVLIHFLFHLLVVPDLS